MRMARAGDGDAFGALFEEFRYDEWGTPLTASFLDYSLPSAMEIPPFDPEIRDGLLYGRGSCDTKGGLASLVAALERVLPAGRLRRR